MSFQLKLHSFVQKKHLVLDCGYACIIRCRLFLAMYFHELQVLLRVSSLHKGIMHEILKDGNDGRRPPILFLFFGSNEPKERVGQLQWQ